MLKMPWRKKNLELFLKNPSQKTKKNKGTIMTKNSLLMPLFKKIDKVFFGIEDVYEIEKPVEGITSENEEHYEAEETVI